MSFLGVTQTYSSHEAVVKWITNYSTCNLCIKYILNTKHPIVHSSHILQTLCIHKALHSNSTIHSNIKSSSESRTPIYPNGFLLQLYLSPILHYQCLNWSHSSMDCSSALRKQMNEIEQNEVAHSFPRLVTISVWPPLLLCSPLYVQRNFQPLLHLPPILTTFSTKTPLLPYQIFNFYTTNGLYPR